MISDCCGRLLNIDKTGQHTYRAIHNILMQPLCSSFLMASQAVCPPILIGIDFDLSETKTWFVKRTTPHSPARPIQQHSVEASRIMGT